MLTSEEFMSMLKKENGENAPAYLAYLQGCIDGWEDCMKTLEDKEDSYTSQAEKYAKEMKKADQEKKDGD